MIITASGIQFRANPDAATVSSTDLSTTDNDTNNNGIDIATAQIDKGMYVCMYVHIYVSIELSYLYIQIHTYIHRCR